MRLARLLLIMLVVLVLGRTVAGQNSVSTMNRHKTSTSQDYVRPFQADRYGTQLLRNDRSIAPAVTSEEATCLTMHTLVMARDQKHSDTTHLVAEYNCVPAQQFQTKSAVVVK